MNEKQIEQQHVTETITLINLEKQLLSQQNKQAAQEMEQQSKETSAFKIRTGSNESFYESVVEYRQHEQELLIKYNSVATQEKRIKTLTTMSDSPYFARIDFKEENEVETLYLGIASLRNKDEETLVIDWRAPIANLYYEGELGEAYYESVDEQLQVELLLKRQFKIKEGQILSMVDTSEAINDDFLLEILDEASSSRMKNIVATIQKSQNQIIRDSQSKVMLIEGIAGSGKTSALLQRVAFILYHNRKWLESEQVLLFSPNHLFTDYISTVLPSLGESGIPTQTFRNYIEQLLPGLELKEEVNREELFLSGDENKIERLKSGLYLVKQMTRYTKAITEFGPLFRDLKLDGRIVVPKEKIRGWYQATNVQLPMYQRMVLLQTKLMNKLGGLQNEERKQSWVKEMVDIKIEEVFEANPDMDYTEEKEKSIRKKIAKQLVEKKFRKIERLIQNYRFINAQKQYLHFLQNVSPKILADKGITQEQWNDSLKELRQHLKNKEIPQEDAVLFFLLLKKLHPVDVLQKARYIFVDEMQDFSPAQVALLRQLYPKANMTFCGDLNQKVFGNETIVASINDLFPEQPVTRFQLTTSYRSTKEITDFANQFLAQEEQVETTARDGKLPTLVQSSKEGDTLNWLLKHLTETKEQAQYWRTAIICKHAEDCQDLYDKLPSTLHSEVQLIVDEDDFMKRSLIIIPAYLAKGLEFDRVFAWNVGAETFSTEQDKLVLYTICTRAMHELTLLANQQASQLVANQNANLVETIQL
ncbi:DNA helicase [Enterococcus sp. JM4C]|uniref:RNA polymerase recycling motor HelD n=1 Tax=Candidatus Enterococcus huntleyi TaxID=1857217 RepID=UPI0013798F49|nr:RNA polymerase recycling motor HelD [Enterococcus sp. JM4C]KAF1296808.1 DNA helicase [Enterococcus sp. JM4C]